MARSKTIYQIFKKLQQKSLAKRNKLSAEEFSSDLSNLSKKEKDTLINIRNTKEFSINIVSEDIGEKMADRMHKFILKNKI